MNEEFRCAYIWLDNSGDQVIGGSFFEEIRITHENRRHNAHVEILASSSIYDEGGRHVWFIRPPTFVFQKQLLCS